MVTEVIHPVNCRLHIIFLEHILIFCRSSHLRAPGILHASSESREIGLKYYELAFDTMFEDHNGVEGNTISSPARIYVNWICDIILCMPSHFPDMHSTHLRNVYNTLHPSHLEMITKYPKLRRIAVDHVSHHDCSYMMNNHELDEYIIYPHPCGNADKPWNMRFDGTNPLELTLTRWQSELYGPEVIGEDERFDIESNIKFLYPKVTYGAVSGSDIAVHRERGETSLEISTSQNLRNTRLSALFAKHFMLFMMENTTDGPGETMLFERMRQLPEGWKAPVIRVMQLEIKTKGRR